ncbi:type II toxin-antitoxin system RelE/ParE family toxin [uncultured Anaerococcus sp.]|uniref:type II toxin-antitoxin system RelE/ParE family toxin n=1 Tax=uncultured Anaerococcus sp. TaxID=293428 RepID=UPI0028891AF5|nr:type II toxin-antitoxin system RelE/ParE family toxin [uncultured Anaerococcus sp.]
MQKKTYRLRFLPLFAEDLLEITTYITSNLQNPEAANILVNEIEDAIDKRLENPFIFAPYNSRKPRINPYYRIYVKNYTIFYVVIDDIMEVRRILYSKRDFDNIL